MDEEARNRELRRWRRWDFLGIAVWILTFGPIRWLWNGLPWRGRFYPRKPPRLEYEPPLLSLAKLAEEGVVEPPPPRISNRETLEAVLDLFAFVSGRDRMITASELEVVKSYINASGPENAPKAELENYLERIKTFDEKEFNVKNHCFLLSKSLKHNQVKAAYETLNHLAYLHGLEAEELRAMFKIGDYLGLTAVEIRLADAAGRLAAGGTAQ